MPSYYTTHSFGRSQYRIQLLGSITYIYQTNKQLPTILAFAESLDSVYETHENI